MSSPREWAEPAPPVLAGAALLERAVGYTRGSLLLIQGIPLDSPTPCAGWDLVSLLRHMNDALAALTEAAEIGYVDLLPVRSTDPAVELVERLRGRACALLAAWSDHADTADTADTAASLDTVDVQVADLPLRSDLLAAAGALEISVHGWDVAQACGVDRPLPAALALELLDVVPLFVGDADRPARFAEPVDVPLHARPSSRLLAALGRHAR